MTHTRPLQSWARLTAPGIPALAVIRRPLRIGFDAFLDVGALYPAPEPGNFAEARRARQLYQQRRIAPAAPGASPQSASPSDASPQSASQSASISLLPDESSAHLLDSEESTESENEEPVLKNTDNAGSSHHHKAKKKGTPHGT